MSEAIYTGNPEIYLAIKDMHKESLQWVSKIEHWDIELHFFEEILNHNGLWKLVFSDQKDFQDIVENLRNYIETKYVVELKSLIIDHENYMAGMLRKEADHTGREYVNQHLRFRNELRGIEIEIEKFKAAIYSHAGIIVDTLHYLHKEQNEKTLHDLHEECKNWANLLTFWKVELSFFQHLLEKKNTLALTHDDKKIVSHLQNLITFYNGEVIDELIHDVRENEVLMGKLLEGKVKNKQDEYLSNHVLLKERVHAIEIRLQDFKKELFGFAKRIDDQIKNLF